MEKRIHSFKKWALIEHFGNGEETFTQDIEAYGKLRNLEIISPMGWEVDSATGKLTYKVEIDANQSGIDDIVFSIEKIELEIENRVYRDKDDEDGEVKTMSFLFNKDSIGTDPKVELHGLPFYLQNLEIDFRDSQDLDGEIDLKKVKFTLEMGNIKD